MADGGDLQGVRRWHGILHGLNDARSGEEKNKNDENGDHGPGEFNLAAAVDLRGLLGVIGIAAPEFGDRID